MRRLCLLFLLLPMLSGCLAMDEWIHDDVPPCWQDSQAIGQPGVGRVAFPAANTSMQTREPELASPR
jgi:hypothetical protein